MSSLFKNLLVMVIVAAVVYVLLRLVVGNYSVVNQSMAPGLQIGDRILVSKMAYHFDEPDRGEVVFYKSPANNRDQLKRIIGLPGDYIEVKDNRLCVNNVALVEPYAKNTGLSNQVSYQVPTDSYFVLDDNRTSLDSLADYTVPRQNIQGRAWILTWPPDRWNGVASYPLDFQLAAAEIP